jgi:hypothetical protein
VSYLIYPPASYYISRLSYQVISVSSSLLPMSSEQLLMSTAMSHYTPPISHSMPILPKVGSLPARQNVNRFGLDLHSTGHGAYVSPEVTPNASQPHSHSMYGPSTPLQSVTQSPFVPRGYHSRGSPYSNGRDSTSYATPGDVDPYYYPPVLSSPPRGASNKKKIVKKADGKQPTFLTKLYAILETPEYNHVSYLHHILMLQLTNRSSGGTMKGA